jgi:hypothetical protein
MAFAKTSKILVVVLTLVALGLTVTTFAAINVNQNVGSNGAITTSPNIGVYSESSCTTNKTSITWGSVAAGDTTTTTVYVKNTGTGTLTLNNIAATNWSPSNANTYITVSWNQTGTQLTAGQSTTALITLTVSSSITGITNFSNSITISGSG